MFFPITENKQAVNSSRGLELLKSSLKFAFVVPSDNFCDSNKDF